MNIIRREAEEVFENLICFQREISNPRVMKKEIDELVYILNRTEVGHKNRVITKVIDRDRIKKTITMKINIEVNDSSKIAKVLEHSSQYEYVERFIIKRGYLISISNSMEEFKDAIQLFMREINKDEGEVNNYDLSNNNIIEVSRIGYDGTVLGFDLYLESKEEEEYK